MEYSATERSNCGVNFTTEDLVQSESVEEMYFKMREIEEDDEDDYSDSNSSSDDEGDDADQDEAVEIMEIYETERSKVQAFYSETCKCKMGVGEMACSATLSLEDITDCRNNCSELSSAELDLVILGIIHSSLNCSETSISGRVEKARQSTRMCFSHGKRICKKTFLFLHCLQYFRFHSLVKHYKKNGLTLQTHGNVKRLPSSASIETLEQVVKFIKNIAEEQALLLPGRVPGFKRIDVKLLLSNLTKHGLWKTYFDICMSTGQVSVGYSKFCDLWNQLCPFILIMQPATDLCWTCQKNNRLTKAPICPKQRRKWMWSENKNNISVWPQENENITKCHARQRKCTSKHILKKPILRLDRDLANTKEQYITRTTTHSSCTTPQILTSQDQSILKRQENVHSLVHAVKQFLAKSIFLLTKTF